VLRILVSAIVWSFHPDNNNVPWMISRGIIYRAFLPERLTDHAGCAAGRTQKERPSTRGRMRGRRRSSGSLSTCRPCASRASARYGWRDICHCAVALWCGEESRSASLLYAGSALMGHAVGICCAPTGCLRLSACGVSYRLLCVAEASGTEPTSWGHGSVLRAQPCVKTCCWGRR